MFLACVNCASGFAAVWPCIVMGAVFVGTCLKCLFHSRKKKCECECHDKEVKEDKEENK